jgi:hypothetical protein
MRLRYMFTLTTLVGIVFGVPFLLAPDWVVSIFGVQTNAVGILGIRLFGGACVSYGVLAWLSRGSSIAEARKAVIPAFILAFTLGFIVSLFAQLAGLLNVVGWLGTVFYLVLGLGFAYFYFGKAQGS